MQKHTQVTSPWISNWQKWRVSFKTISLVCWVCVRDKWVSGTFGENYAWAPCRLSNTRRSWTRLGLDHNRYSPCDQWASKFRLAIVRSVRRPRRTRKRLPSNKLKNTRKSISAAELFELKKNVAVHLTSVLVPQTGYHLATLLLCFFATNPDAYRSGMWSRSDSIICLGRKTWRRLRQSEKQRPKRSLRHCTKRR